MCEEMTSVETENSTPQCKQNISVLLDYTLVYIPIRREDKFFPLHAIRGRSGRTAVFIVNLDPKWRWVVELAALVLGKNIRTLWTEGQIDPKTGLDIL